MNELVFEIMKKLLPLFFILFYDISLSLSQPTKIPSHMSEKTDTLRIIVVEFLKVPDNFKYPNAIETIVEKKLREFLVELFSKSDSHFELIQMPVARKKLISLLFPEIIGLAEQLYENYDIAIWGEVTPIIGKFPNNYNLKLRVFTNRSRYELCVFGCDLRVEGSTIISWDEKECKLDEDAVAFWPMVMCYKHESFSLNKKDKSFTQIPLDKNIKEIYKQLLNTIPRDSLLSNNLKNHCKSDQRYNLTVRLNNGKILDIPIGKEDRFSLMTKQSSNIAFSYPFGYGIPPPEYLPPLNPNNYDLRVTQPPKRVVVNKTKVDAHDRGLFGSGPAAASASPATFGFDVSGESPIFRLQTAIRVNLFWGFIKIKDSSKNIIILNFGPSYHYHHVGNFHFFLTGAIGGELLDGEGGIGLNAMFGGGIDYRFLNLGDQDFGLHLQYTRGVIGALDFALTLGTSFPLDF